jgi:hypothetical protein
MPLTRTGPQQGHEQRYSSHRFVPKWYRYSMTSGDPVDPLLNALLDQIIPYRQYSST